MNEWLGWMQGHALLSLFQLTPKHSRQAILFTAINLYQAVLPRNDAARICMYDSPLSTPLLGRSLATIGEVAFAEQLERYTNVPGIIETTLVANWLCWLGCLTGWQVYHVFEKALWMITCTRILLSYAKLDARTIAFVAFIYIWMFDIPYYTNRASNLRSIAQGFQEMQTCKKNTDWRSWHEDALWMAAFNVGGTQLSLYMG